MRFSAKVAVITGGGAGIGKATAIAFAQEGAAVVVADIDAKTAESVAAEIIAAGGQAKAVQADVSRSADAQRISAEAVSAFGGIDVLVNNAGNQTYGTVIEKDEETWDSHINGNRKELFV